MKTIISGRHIDKLRVSARVAFQTVLVGGFLSVPVPHLSAQMAVAGPGMTASQPKRIVEIGFDRFGPIPRQVSRPSGPFILIIRPRSLGIERADTFTLSPQSSASATAVPAPSASALVQFTPAQHRDIDYQQLNLMPGVYNLVFSNHPEWTVTLTITN